MKVYCLPSKIQALVFDMDLTLYSNAEYGEFQIDSMVERLGIFLGLSFKEMKSRIDKARKDWALSSGGKKQSLSNIIQSYGISMEEMVHWREELFEPKKFLVEDSRLERTLAELARSFALGVVSNNPVLIIRKTLKALGVEKCFPFIVGLDTCMVSKPHELPFRKFSEISKLPLETCVSIGDRFDIDLGIPLSMGMGGILVDGVEDVYNLPDLLIKGEAYDF